MLCDELLMLGEISEGNSAWQVEHCSRWRWGARCFGEQAENPAIHQKQPSLGFSIFFKVVCSAFLIVRELPLWIILWKPTDGFQDFSNSNVFHRLVFQTFFQQGIFFRFSPKNTPQKKNSPTGGASGPGGDRPRGLALPPCAGGPVPRTTEERRNRPGPGAEPVEPVVRRRWTGWDG